MEAHAAAKIFSRSVNKRRLIYGTMICDGDSKSHAAAVNHSGLDIVKEDCINHISKRMYNALEALKAANKSSLNYKLTKPNIEKLTNSYSSNLRQNAPDINKMKMAVMGSFFHMMSTDKDPNHRLCPDGDKSWCHFKRSLALKEKPRKHTPTFSADVGKLIFPIVKRLTEPELLTRCAKMGTQSANESFHSTIWRRCGCAKIDHASSESVEIANCLAILSFNCGKIGIKSVFQHLKVVWTVKNNDFVAYEQKLKLKLAAKTAAGISKWKRKNLKKRRLAAEHQAKSKEGESYRAGQFNV